MTERELLSHQHQTQGDTVTNYIYQLKGGEMKVIKRDFKKSS